MTEKTEKEEFASKIFMGHTFDINIKADQLEYKSQGQISRKWLEMRSTEFLRRKIYWFFIGLTIALVFATVFINMILVIPLFISFWQMIYWHLQYLKAWSARMKYDKRVYTRMDAK